VLTGQLVNALPTTPSRIISMTRVPAVDNQLVLLTGHVDGTVTLWQINHGERLEGVAVVHEHFVQANVCTCISSRL
jgi:hypothetical protein